MYFSATARGSCVPGILGDTDRDNNDDDDDNKTKNYTEKISEQRADGAVQTAAATPVACDRAVSSRFLRRLAKKNLNTGRSILETC